MTTIDAVTCERRSELVTKADRAFSRCVKITTESGIELECSITAPIADEFGNKVEAPDLLGIRIPVYDQGKFRLELVVAIKDIGVKEIIHITCGNKFFLAGKEKGRYLFHHNLKPFEIVC